MTPGSTRAPTAILLRQLQLQCSHAQPPQRHRTASAQQHTNITETPCASGGRSAHATSRNPTCSVHSVPQRFPFRARRRVLFGKISQNTFRTNFPFEMHTCSSRTAAPSCSLPLQSFSTHFFPLQTFSPHLFADPIVRGVVCTPKFWAACTPMFGSMRAQTFTFDSLMLVAPQWSILSKGKLMAETLQQTDVEQGITRLFPGPFRKPISRTILLLLFYEW